MNKSEADKFEVYDYKSFVKKKLLGAGSYSIIKLLSHKELNLVVGKFFQFNGDCETIKKEQTSARKEAAFLSKFKHKNIIRFIGTTSHKNYFILILEYITCGNLKNLLHFQPEIVLPWKIRARFFAELAEALNYLHYHKHGRHYIHGDLKPQNILLTDTLRSCSTMSIDSGKNTQHTPLYSAPEFLRNPHNERSYKMDVYSYGLIGFEVVTRKRVFSGSFSNNALLEHLIREVGQKPDVNMLDEVIENLKEMGNSCDFTICDKLKKIVLECWKFKADDRPKISEVKTDLEILTQAENVYDEATDEEAKTVVNKMKQMGANLNQSAEPGLISKDGTGLRFGSEALHKSKSSKLLKQCAVSETDQINKLASENTTPIRESFTENATTTQESFPENANPTRKSFPKNATPTRESFPENASPTRESFPENVFPTRESFKNITPTRESFPENATPTQESVPENSTQVAETSRNKISGNILFPRRNNAIRKFHESNSRIRQFLQNMLGKIRAFIKNENQIQKRNLNRPNLL